ncbi:MAG: glycine--tRNA ligase subunit beta [Lachnospiraceae bacterium]|nr:glycine--tRNA ligase subunit beta [Lachnospiraceae bacterium]
MSTFVLEIGSEELPSRFLPGQKQFLLDTFATKLSEAGLAFGSINVFCTPRRACVEIQELADRQEVREEIVAGPPLRIAYDADGKPGKALLGFLRTQGVNESDIFEQKTEKGVYIAAKKTSGGKSAKEILAEISPAIIASIPYAKRMRWADHSISHARPLHWILALLDSEIVPFNLGPIASGRETFGHRIHGLGPFAVGSASEYFTVIRDKACVMLDAASRRQTICEMGDAEAKRIGGRVLWKESLLEEVEGLVEHPLPLLADFDPSYLEVPKEVLLTSMESHQKSFGIADADGHLLPHFLTVLNIVPEDLSVVKKGWERVLHARLDDARFFWREDLRSSFDAWLGKLDHVIFIGPLGSMGDKSRRVEELTAWLAKRIFPEDHDLAVKAARAGRLCKADLVSGMVGEFDTLQGIMGGIYARRMGEDELVAKAISAQYLPSGPDSPMPDTVLGALLSMADKADTLAGCFGLNRIPTGTADPFALRRCALGIIRIVKEFGFDLSVRELLQKAFDLYGERAWKLGREEALAKLQDFVGARLQNYLQGQGNSVVLTEACLRAGMDDIPDVCARLAALADFSKHNDYVPSVQIMKRIANILQKQKQVPENFDKSLFEHASEGQLAEKLTDQETLGKNRKYPELLATLLELRPYVDSFFDSVMVLCEDAKVRDNRLALLHRIHSLYACVADFSALQI